MKTMNTSINFLGCIFLTFIFIFSINVNTLPIGTTTEPTCNNNRGTCKRVSLCEDIFYNYHMIHDSVKFCDEDNSIVCCPKRFVPLPVDTTKIFQRECQNFNDSHNNCTSTPFIVNGTDAKPREFPFMALIGLDQPKEPIKWICGGTLISRNYVLTAAHCLETTLNNPIYRVRLGELDHAVTTDDAQPQDFNVNSYIIHPDYYENDDKHNDIALLKLDGVATLNEYVYPVCLPVSDGNELPSVIAAGWGQTNQFGSASTHLQKVVLDRFDDVDCAKILNDTVQLNLRTQICAGSFNTNHDTCQGDSGGPIFVQHPVLRCMRQIVGITSFGGICGTKNMPSVYTRVHLYTNWIENIVWKSLKSK